MIHPPFSLIFHPAVCLETFIIEFGKGTSLVADHLILHQVVLGYMVPVLLFE